MHNFIWILIKICLQVLLGLGGGIHSTECHSSFLVQTNWSCLSLSPVGLHHCLDLSLLFAHLFILYHFISFFVILFCLILSRPQRLLLVALAEKVHSLFFIQSPSRSLQFNQSILKMLLHTHLCSCYLSGLAGVSLIAVCTLHMEIHSLLEK